MFERAIACALILTAAGGCGSSNSSGTTTPGGGAAGANGGAGSSSGGTAGTSGGTGGAQPTCSKPGDMPFVWAQSVSKESAGINGMALGADDSIYLAGLYTSKLTLGVGQPNETVLMALLGGRDAFFAKLAADGTLVWAKSAGGTADDYGEDVSVAADGSLRVVGTFEGTGLFGSGEPNETKLQANGMPDFFVAKYGSDGLLGWAKRASAVTVGGGTFGASFARAATDGSVRVLGSFSGDVSFAPGEANETELTAALPAGDMFLASYTPDGALAWVKRIEGSQFAGNSLSGRGADLAVAADGTAIVIVTGNVKFAPGEANETSLGGPAVNVARYDATGALTKAQSYGGGGQLGVASLAADGNLYVAGMFTDTITFAMGEPNQTSLTAGAEVDSAYTYFAQLAPDGSLGWAKEAQLGVKGAVPGLVVAADGKFRVLAQYFNQATLGPGELSAVQLTKGSGLIANYDSDGSLIFAKDVSRWHSASNVPPAPPYMHALTASANDGSLRVLGFAGTSDPITLGEGEPGQIVLTGVSNFIAKYNICP